MRNKKVVSFLTIMFILLVVALPTVCVFIPYREPYFSDTTGVFYDIDEKGENVYYFMGEITNPSIVKIEEIKLEIFFYDGNGSFVSKQTIETTIDLASGQTHEFLYMLSVVVDDLGYWEIVNAEYAFTILQPYYYYAIGVCLFGVTMLFFAKKKFYFSVDNHTVEVYADARKATLIIDGKLYKELKTKMISEKGMDSCKFKIKGKILEIKLKPGTYFPNIAITLDGVVPKFTKIKQHSFLKAYDRKAEKNTSK